MLISLDTETTGVDLYHGAKPFIVTLCDEEFNNTIYEWDVVPGTRDPQPPPQDINEIVDMLQQADEVVLQNAKFDVTALSHFLPKNYRWPWYKTRDTLLAGHLLASNHAHDLTSMAIEYLAIDVAKYETVMRKVV